MGRYRGTVEQARQELRAKGLSVQDAHELAPRLAQMRQAEADRHTPPYRWLGGRAHEGKATEDA
jgi:hypothetical protein